MSEPKCGKSLEGTESCVLFKNLQIAIKDVNEVLTIHNRVLTTRGGKTVDPEYVKIPKNGLMLSMTLTLGQTLHLKT